MKRTCIGAMILLILSFVVCFGSTMLIHATLDEMENLHEATLSCTDEEDKDGAIEHLVQLGTVWSKASPWMEMLTSHEDIHNVREQIVSSKALLEHDDLAQYHQCMALLRESIDHIRRHESMTLSNLF